MYSACSRDVRALHGWRKVPVRSTVAQLSHSAATRVCEKLRGLEGEMKLQTVFVPGG